MTLSIRARLSLWYLAVFFVMVAGLGLFLVVRLQGSLVHGVDEALVARAQGIAQGLSASGEGDFESAPDETVLPALRQAGVVAQLLDGSGRVLQAAGDDVPERPLLTGATLARSLLEPYRSTLHLPGRRPTYRILALPFRLTGGTLVLVTGQSLEGIRTAVDRLVVLLLAAAPVALALSALGGWALARAALRPVDVMTRTAAAVDATRPHDPIPVPRGDDELGRLARTLNAMLDRLRRALDEERRFSADASHELRTPLGVMAAELDVALRSPALPDPGRDVLASVREDVARLARLVENLLVLSRAEALGEVKLARRRVDLLELAGVAQARFRDQARHGGLDFSVEGSTAQAWVDPELILQALANLVDNAIKFTPPVGVVRIVVVDSAGEPRLEVRDTGPGIPAEELAAVFERFYRVDPARRRTTGGAGLGLAIARRLVEAHGGRLAAASEPGRGATFTIWLPPAPPEPHDVFRESSETPS